MEEIKEGESLIFVLHGHGTGVLKKGIRSWLAKASMIKRWRPAQPHEGGDAFTMIELRV